jgi:methylmalonyl-CoA/ethylmalonyl-CoA epimerase
METMHAAGALVRCFLVRHTRNRIVCRSSLNWKTQEGLMGKLRHIAIAVADTDAAAKFYEQAFGMTRVRESANSVMLSDGVISLAILNNKTNHEALGHEGLHHVGFITEDVEGTSTNAERSGAAFADTEENVIKRFANRGQMQDGKITEAAQKQDQRKYVDPNGIKFDIVNNEHARNSWRLPV